MSELGDRIVDYGPAVAGGVASPFEMVTAVEFNGLRQELIELRAQRRKGAVKITTDMLDKFNAGHNFAAVTRLREILALTTGEPIELHIYELAELRELRERIAMLTERADAIEARGPMPEVGGIAAADDA